MVCVAEEDKSATLHVQVFEKGELTVDTMGGLPPHPDERAIVDEARSYLRDGAQPARRSLRLSRRPRRGADQRRQPHVAGRQGPGHRKKLGLQHLRPRALGGLRGIRPPARRRLQQRVAHARPQLPPRGRRPAFSSTPTTRSATSPRAKPRSPFSTSTFPASPACRNACCEVPPRSPSWSRSGAAKP